MNIKILMMGYTETIIIETGSSLISKTKIFHGFLKSIKASIW